MPGYILDHSENSSDQFFHTFQTGRLRIILPETVAEFEHRLSDVWKTFRLSPGLPLPVGHWAKQGIR